MITSLFEAIDEKNSVAFVSFLTSSCRFQFGNQPEMTGKAEIQNYVTQFFSAIESLSHTISESWITQDACICRGLVTYTRASGRQLTVPFANIMKLESDLIFDYQIYADTSLLFVE